MKQSEKVRENRLRRAAERQGLQLSRSRRRDPRALDYAKYYLRKVETDELVSPDKGLTMDEIEARLLG